MAKMVGLARPLKIGWLDKTVDLLIDGKTTVQIKDDLNTFLTFEISSPTSLRKTRESLINTWVIPNEDVTAIRTDAVEVYRDNRQASLPIHWCMLTLSYPIFADISTLIGKISTIEDTFTTMWVREKLYESWGERTTLDVPVKNILRTMIDFGVLTKEKPGVYRVVQFPVHDDATIRIILRTILALKQRAYYGLADLSSSPLMYPFHYEVTHEFIYNSTCFDLGNFGGQTVII